MGFEAEYEKVEIFMSCDQGVLHNDAAVFIKGSRCIGPKLRLKSILLLYKDLLEIKSCIPNAIFKLNLPKILQKVYNNDCYKFFTPRTLSYFMQKFKIPNHFLSNCKSTLVSDTMSPNSDNFITVIAINFSFCLLSQFHKF